MSTRQQNKDITFSAWMFGPRLFSMDDSQDDRPGDVGDDDEGGDKHDHVPVHFLDDGDSQLVSGGHGRSHVT